MFTFKKISKCTFSLKIAYFYKYVSIILLHIHKMSLLRLYIASNWLLFELNWLFILQGRLQGFYKTLIKLNLHLLEWWTGPSWPPNYDKLWNLG